MTKLDRFKNYMDICGITMQKELKDAGYPKTVQYLGGVLSGKYGFSEEEEKLCYNACNIARAKKLREQVDMLIESAKETE